MGRLCNYYGRFFLHWYAQSLIDHADNVLSLASLAFEETRLIVKIPGVYWWYKIASHVAELVAGYHNPTNQDGFSPIFEVLKKHGVTMKFVCLGFQLSSQEADEMLADPECLTWLLTSRQLIPSIFHLSLYNVSVTSCGYDGSHQAIEQRSVLY